MEAKPLRRLEDRFEAVLEAASDVILVLDDESRIVFANAAVQEMFGHQVADLLGREMAMLIPPELRERHREGMRHYLATGKRRIPWRGVRLPGLHASGRRIQVEASFGAFEEEGTTYFAGVVRNIQARVDEERRRDAEHSASRILAEATSVEEAANRITRSLAEALHWQVAELWVPREGLLCPLASFSVSAVYEPVTAGDPGFAPGEGLPGTVWREKRPHWIRGIDADPGFRRAEIAGQVGLRTALASPIVLADRCFGVLVIYTIELLDRDPALMDTAEAIGQHLGHFFHRREAEQERDRLLARERTARAAAERETASRERILAVVSHDLRTMLQALRLRVETAMRVGGEQVSAKRLARLRATVEDMSRLVQDLLDISALEAGQMRLELAPIAPERLVTEILELAAPLTDGLALTAELPPSLPAVYGDARRLRQIFTNLVHNAVKFTDAGGAITLRAAQRDGGVVFSVEDNGAGIPSERQGSLLQGFWSPQVHSEDGAGLGLSIVKLLVSLHGGEIWLDSEPGRGTTVSFTVPAAGTQEVPDPPEEP